MTLEIHHYTRGLVCTKCGAYDIVHSSIGCDECGRLVFERRKGLLEIRVSHP